MSGFDFAARGLAARAGARGRAVASSFAHAAIMASLRAGQSAALGVMGDSTAAGTDRWFAKLGGRIGAAVPGVRVEYREFDNAAQDYGVETVLVAGSGGRRGVQPGTAGRMIPAADIGDWSGDLDLRVLIDPASWTPASRQTFISRDGRAAGAYGFDFHWATISGAPYPRLEWSSDGAVGAMTAVTGSPLPTTGSPLWVRCRFRPNNGAGGYEVRFQTSTDGAAWTDCGVTSTSAGTSAIFKPGGQAYAVGGLGPSATSAVFAGKIHAAEVRDGIGGRVMTPEIDTWRQVPGTTSTLTGAPTLRLWAGAVSGQNVAYLSPQARVDMLGRPAWGANLVYLATGHNENHATAFADIDAWLARLRARLPRAAFAVVQQNPRLPLAGKLDFHAQFVREFGQWGMRGGMTVVPAFDAFSRSAAGLAALLNTDGIHPLDAGYELWADTAFAAFDAAG